MVCIVHYCTSCRCSHNDVGFFMSKDLDNQWCLSWGTLQALEDSCGSFSLKKRSGGWMGFEPSIKQRRPLNLLQEAI